MEKCETCVGEGLIKQGDSINKVCTDCSGTGSVVGLSDNNENNMNPEENTEVVAEEVVESAPVENETEVVA